MERKKGKRYFTTVCQRPGREGWYVRFSYAGRRVWRLGGLSRGDAEAYAATVTKRVKAGLPPEEEKPSARVVLFETFLSEHLKLLDAEHSPTTVRDEKNRLNNVALPFFTGRNLADISVAEVEKFLLARTQEGASPATRNRYASVLSRLFERARAYGHIDRNPVRQVKRQREQERPVPALSIAEQDALLAACDERIRDYVLLSLDTGLRQAEALGLEWSHVDLNAGTVTVRKSKSGKARTVPLTRRLLTRLEDLKSTRVVPLHGPDRVLSRIAAWTWTERKMYRAAATEAGYPHLRPHDLRHLCGTNLARAGVPLPDIGRWLGHSANSLSVTMRYARHAPANAANAALVLLEARMASQRAPAAAIV